MEDTYRTRKGDEARYDSPSSCVTKIGNSSRRTRRACDRCRLKKAKCDGKSPCSTCVSYQRTCIFSARRRREVRSWLCEMQDVLDEAIQVLYSACKQSNSFPGTLPSEDGGLVSTEEILRGLGLVKMNLETQSVEGSTEITEGPQITYQDVSGMRLNPDRLPSSNVSLPFFLAQNPTLEVVYELDPNLSNISSTIVNSATSYEPHVRNRDAIQDLKLAQLYRQCVNSSSNHSKSMNRQTTTSVIPPLFTEHTTQMPESSQLYAVHSREQVNPYSPTTPEYPSFQYSQPIYDHHHHHHYQPRY